MESVYYIKKFKQYQIAQLYTLYTQHAEYLLRVIKSVAQSEQEITEFAGKIEQYISEATCHEIAINSFFHCDLATHQNSRGKERQYCEHPAAEHVGRDLRVKLVWELIQSEISENSSLDQFKKYSDLNRVKEIVCPYCNTVLFRQGREYMGVHEDGTANYQESWEEVNYCECWVMNDFQDTQVDEEVNSLLKEIQNEVDDCREHISPIESLGFLEFHNSNLEAICETLLIGYETVMIEEFSRYSNPYGEFVCFVEDKERLVRALESILRRTEMMSYITTLD